MHAAVTGAYKLAMIEGQPLVCDICNDNHKAADCPLKGKCKRCHEARHFVRHCPKPVWYVPGNPATDVDSENDDDDDNGNGNDNDNLVNEDVGDVHTADGVAVAAPVVVPGTVELASPQFSRRLCLLGIRLSLSLLPVLKVLLSMFVIMSSTKW